MKTSSIVIVLLVAVSSIVFAYVHDDLDFGYISGDSATTVSTGNKIVVQPMNYEMVYIPPGTFQLGSPSSEWGRDDDERQHGVKLIRGFYLGVTEVTQVQWRKVMGSSPSYFKNCDECPVEQVSWEDCQEFIRRLNRMEGTAKYRLPTEAQWEYACRAGCQGAYCFGNNSDKLDQYAWYSNKYRGKTHPVAGKKPNAWGLYDMHGNVWEWCSDWYGDYPSGSVTDPDGPSTGSRRVSRGGSWVSSAGGCRSAYRSNVDLSYRSSSLGFRLSRTQ